MVRSAKILSGLMMAAATMVVAGCSNGGYAGSMNITADYPSEETTWGLIDELMNLGTPAEAGAEMRGVVQEMRTAVDGALGVLDWQTIPDTETLKCGEDYLYTGSTSIHETLASPRVLTSEEWDVAFAAVSSIAKAHGYETVRTFASSASAHDVSFIGPDTSYFAFGSWNGRTYLNFVAPCRLSSDVKESLRTQGTPFPDSPWDWPFPVPVKPRYS